MSSLYIAANQILSTPFGHLQFVLDPDGVFDNGDETEIEVQSPNALATGPWDVRPEQAFQVPDNAITRAVEITLDTSQSVDDVWTALLNARDDLATRGIDYRLGLFGDAEGQNSNTYIRTLAHIVDIDISGAVDTFLDSSLFTEFPGVARNVLFDHLASDDTALPPVPLFFNGSLGDDILNGGLNRDQLNGRDGNDLISGLGGADVLIGEDGDDTLFGDGGEDILLGGDQRDWLFGGDDNDDLSGGAQKDRLYGEGGDDLLEGGGGRDRLWGQSGKDSLYGDAGRDIARGGGGGDLVDGGAGNDDLLGQNGKDDLVGGTGNDWLKGGRGADYFIFDGDKDEGFDQIVDFQLDIDSIWITGVAFSDLEFSDDTDTTISFGTGTEVTLIGITASELVESDFIFDLA